MRRDVDRDAGAAVAFARNIQQLDATLDWSTDAGVGAAAIKAPACPPGPQFGLWPTLADGHPSRILQTQPLAVSRTSPEVY
jgi:hypothetical protein